MKMAMLLDAADADVDADADADGGVLIMITVVVEENVVVTAMMTNAYR
jgi:hypothetical protein